MPSGASISSLSPELHAFDDSRFSKDRPSELAGNRSARIGFVLERDDLPMLFCPESTKESMPLLVLQELKISNSSFE